MIPGTLVELRIKGMEHAIVQCFTDYEIQLGTEIKEIVHKTIKNFNWEREVQMATEKVLHDNVQYYVSESLRPVLKGKIETEIEKAISKIYPNSSLYK